MPATKRIMMIRPGRRFPRMVFAPPLGFLYLISMLRDRFPGRFEIDLVEQPLYDYPPGEIRERMLDFRPDLVCFSCMSVESNELRELCAMSKELFPEVPVWIGGPHASVFYDWELELGNVDAACIGEGEDTFMEMIEAWLADAPLDNVAGLALLREGEVVTTGARAPIMDLDSIPFPAWDLVDFKRYAGKTSMNVFVAAMPWTNFFTTRACPFQCVYCHQIFGKKVRKRSVENAMEELELLVRQYGIREIHIVDDIFNLDLPRAKQICDQIVERGLDIKIAFPNGLRADRMDRELIRKLKAAGCYSITYAIETASPRLQKLIKKNLDLDKARQVIEWTDREKIIVQAFFMIGFPGETMDEIWTTIRFALESPILRPFFFTVVVYPRLGLFEMAKQECPDFDFEGYNFFNLRYYGEEPFYTQVTGVDLYQIQKQAFEKFLLRPGTIMKILWRFPKNRWLFYGLFYAARSIIPSLSWLEERFRPVQKSLTQWWESLKNRLAPA